MAAKTPTIIDLGGTGGSRMLLAQFSDIDDGDTWTTGLLNIVDYSPINNKTDGVVISATLSAGVFTFTVAGAGSNKAGSMIVYVRS